MIYKHWSDYKGPWPWKNFPIIEVSCRCCGEYFHDPITMDMIQAARMATGKPIFINSGHRCVSHNKNEGGAKRSMHLGLALDCSNLGYEKDPRILRDALHNAGFVTFGYYGTFIHTDKRSRPRRTWYSKTGRKLWSRLV